MESIGGGDLYQLQQEAIRRARETAQKAAIKEQPRHPLPLPAFALKDDTLVIAAILAVLLLNGCRDTLLIAVLVFLLLK